MIIVGDILLNPRFILNDSLKGQLGYEWISRPKSFKINGLRAECSSYLPDLIPSKLSFGIRFSLGFKRIKPSLIYAISHIISLSPKEKMVGINAGRIVAFMANAHMLRNGSFVKLIRKSVSRNIWINPPSNTNSSIALSIFGSLPNPAAISLSYFTKKSNFNGNNKSWHNINNHTYTSMSTPATI